jgi:hypothetical protein
MVSPTGTDASTASTSKRCSLYFRFVLPLRTSLSDVSNPRQVYQVREPLIDHSTQQTPVTYSGSSKLDTVRSMLRLLDHTEPAPMRRLLSCASGEDVVETRRRSRVSRPSAKEVPLTMPNSFGKESPFENVHPLRGPMWTETEDAIDGRSYPERRILAYRHWKSFGLLRGSSRTSKQTSGQRCIRQNGTLLGWYPRRFAGGNRIALDSGLIDSFAGSILVSGPMFWHHE